uniref:Uncharacterized protein n=1 Tax=Timema shepardi TaxID=629360 RepID=A0A7R9B117_TIMSH|nr:unnamed protein product [Timema shepardi]
MAVFLKFLSAHPIGIEPRLTHHLLLPELRLPIHDLTCLNGAAPSRVPGRHGDAPPRGSPGVESSLRSAQSTRWSPPQ